MTKWPTHIDEDYLEPFFFEAMITGYVGGNPGIPSQDPGYAEVLYEHGDYKLVDKWMSAPSPRGTSHGDTRIWYRNIPVWYMQYAGFYPKVAIPVVRKAVSLAYKQVKFLGGRGVRYMEKETEKGVLIYSNMPDKDHDTFASFSGEEVVYNERQLLVGFHHYAGGLIR